MRSWRSLLKKALKLSCLVNTALLSSGLLPSHGLKPWEGKMQRFDFILSCCVPHIPVLQPYCKSSLPPSTNDTVSVNSTVWRKQKSGLQYWGASWSQKGSQGSRIRCPHSQFEKGDYSLQINDVTEEDGGFYSCNLEIEKHVFKKVVLLRIIKGKTRLNPVINTYAHACSPIPDSVSLMRWRWLT